MPLKACPCPLLDVLPQTEDFAQLFLFSMKVLESKVCSFWCLFAYPHRRHHITASCWIHFFGPCIEKVKQKLFVWLNLTDFLQANGRAQLRNKKVCTQKHLLFMTHLLVPDLFYYCGVFGPPVCWRASPSVEAQHQKRQKKTPSVKHGTQQHLS